MPTTPLGDVRPPKSTASRLPNGRRLAWSGCAWLLLQSMIVGQGLEPIADQQPPGAAPVRSEEAPPPSTPTSPAAAEVENFFPDDPAVTGPAAVGPAASDSTTTPSPAAVPATTPSAVPATTTAEEPAAAAGVTLAEVDELRKRVEAAELTEEQRKQAATSLQQAAEDVAATDKLRGATIDFQERKQGQQATRDTLQLEIESLQNTELATPDMELPLATLESQLLELKTRLAKANTELDTYLSRRRDGPRGGSAADRHLFAAGPARDGPESIAGGAAGGGADDSDRDLPARGTFAEGPPGTTAPGLYRRIGVDGWVRDTRPAASAARG
ncbi:MAG: hypothetical protein R3B90_02210 [Planctomycetaceae bacterium]